MKARVVELLLVLAVVAAAGAVYHRMHRPETPSPELWEKHYQAGVSAIGEGDTELAERELRTALELAERFPPGDRRLAETLDDLGLVYFKLQDFEQSERMQGRAVTELLLAGGPNDPELTLYTERLGWVYATQGKPKDIEEFQDKPYRILGRGYAPEGPRMEENLSRLLGEYSQDPEAKAFVTDFQNR